MSRSWRPPNVVTSCTMAPTALLGSLRRSIQPCCVLAMTRAGRTPALVMMGVMVMGGDSDGGDGG